MLIRSFVKDDIISDITLHGKLNYVEVKVKRDLSVFLFSKIKEKKVYFISHGK